MPQKKGASVRATTPRRGASADARKPGSRSPKHRGHRPDDAADAPTAKKARWDAETRIARGKSAERPRGTESRSERDADARPRRADESRPQRGEYRARGAESRPQRERRDDARVRQDRVERGAERRPNWEPREKTSRFESRAGYRDGARSGGRPARDAEPRRRFDDAERAPRRDVDRERPARRSFEGESPRRRDGIRRDDARRAAPAEAPREAAPAPVEDVVLDRLEAQAIVAAEVDGVGFAELGLGQNIVRALGELGAESPFPIQAGTIPQVLAGRDVLARGRTGSGKTIAFGAPLVERLLQQQAGSTERRRPGRAPRALILAPTRELALQIDRTVQPIARSVGLFTTQIYGGVPYARQLGALDRGVDIVIGTPGRVQDLSAQGRLDLSQVVVTVLDEADHMCELGFLEPVQEILDRTREGGQKLLFSATLDSGVAEIVDRYLVDPSVHEVAGEDQASSTIEHRVLLLDQRDKLDVLAELAGGPGKKLVFARTRSFAEQLADFLDDADVPAESIHGDLTQSRRQRALEKFSRGRVRALVATDVAARGIHVDDVDLVIQADAPDEYKAYLHRAGRTGRAGKAGTVVTLVARNRRRRVEELLQRAEITAEWTQVRPGDALLRDLAAGTTPAAG